MCSYNKKRECVPVCQPYGFLKFISFANLINLARILYFKRKLERKIQEK